jgi:hypothetical protein
MRFGGGVSGNTDTVPAMLTPGEYVINKEAAQKIGRDKLDTLNRTEKPKKAKSLGDGLFEHKQMGGEVGTTTTTGTDSAAYQWALNQLPSQEREALQKPTMGGGLNPLMIQAQKDLQNYIQQYSTRAETAKTAATPSAPSGEKNPQTTPSTMGQGQINPATGNPMPYTAPQTGANTQGYWPAGSTVYPGQYVMGPNQPGSAPGTSTGDILATGDQATATPQAQQGLSSSQLQGIAGGIGQIGQAWGQAFQNNAKLSWHNIPAGPWANPAQYESQEQRNYGQYEYPMQQFQII